MSNSQNRKKLWFISQEPAARMVDAIVLANRSSVKKAKGNKSLVRCLGAVFSPTINPAQLPGFPSGCVTYHKLFTVFEKQMSGNGWGVGGSIT